MTYSWEELFATSSLVAVFTVLIMWHFRLYEMTVSLLNIREVENTIRAVSYVFLAVVVAFFFYPNQVFSRWTVLLSGFGVLSVVLVQRNISARFVRWLYEREFGVRRVLIYGTKYGVEVAKKLDRNPRLGLVCAGFLEDSPSTVESLAEHGISAPVLGLWEDLAEVVARHDIDEIIISDSHVTRQRIKAIVEESSRLRLSVSFVPDLMGPFPEYFTYELWGGLPIARCRNFAENPATRMAKRVFDFAISLFLVLFLVPAFVVIAIVIKLDSPGPALFRQLRVGKNGRLFEMLKFRSMYVESRRFERSPSSSDDPRITRSGKILRRTSLDEIPQLFNVLAGKMSLVGPRPEMPYIVQKYGPVEACRLEAKPGVTGLWQISPARAMPIHENIEYDLFYVEHQNLFLDCAILLRTIASVVRGVGA